MSNKELGIILLGLIVATFLALNLERAIISMADFNTALPTILKHEGGYSFVAGDSGGETYRGISRNNFPAWEGWQLVEKHKPLKNGEIIEDEELKELVADFYAKNFWNSLKLSNIKDQAVATKIMDMAVNMGVYRAFILIQEVLANKCRLSVAIDGKPGSETIRAINSQSPGYFLNLLRDKSKSFYTNLAERNLT